MRAKSNLILTETTTTGERPKQCRVISTLLKTNYIFNGFLFYIVNKVKITEIFRNDNQCILNYQSTFY